MNSIHFAIVLALASTTTIAAKAPNDANDVFVQGRSMIVASHNQATTAHGAQAVNEAAAAAVIDALETRFDGQSVQFRLDEVRSERESLRDLVLHGRGEIRFEADGTWLPITFDALYDTDTQAVQSPSITLGAQFTPRNDKTLPLDGLKARVDKALATEFAGQQVNFDLQNAQADQATATTIATKFAGDNVDLVLAIATPAATRAASCPDAIVMSEPAVCTSCITAGTPEPLPATSSRSRS